MDVTCLSESEKRRTHRQYILSSLGLSGQERLGSAHVAVIGAGGLGSPVVQYLSAAGVGTLTVIDDDVVEESNLHRQVIHDAAKLGEHKTQSAAIIASRLAPECHVIEVRQRLTAENAVSLLENADVIVDGSDTFDTRFDIASAAEQLSVPVVWGAVLGWDAQVTVFWPHPPKGTPFLPVRLTDVFADTAEIRQVDSCNISGVMGPVCGIAGSMMALETIKLITGTGIPALGKMLCIDGLSGSVREISISAGEESLDEKR